LPLWRPESFPLGRRAACLRLLRRPTVLNTGSSPVAGVTVFLKNDKTKSIRSYSSTADGHYYFAQVNMAEDFDLWAEKDGKKSAVKTVSSWDARKDFISDLKLK